MNLRHILKLNQIYTNNINQYDNQNTLNSVAIIIRKILNPSKPALSFNYQILLLQRATQQNSPFSGQVCFPGGKRQKGQSSWLTALRQTKQQTGLILTQKNLIVKIPQLFFVYQSRNKMHTITMYIFELFLNQKNEYPEIQLNKDEISDYKWIDFDFFTNIDKAKADYLSYTKYKSFPFQYILPLEKHEVDIINNNLQAIKYPCLKVGLQQKLFGFTYYVIMSLMNGLLVYLKKNKKVEQIFAKKIQQSLSFSHDFKVILKDNCPSKQRYERIASKTFQQSMSMFTGVWPEAKL